MANPYRQVASAKIEVDATQASGLEGLTLEVDDQIIGKITPSEISTIQIADLLQPQETRILRFQATFPLVMLPHGTEFPIHLRFIVDDQIINGYTHIVRVAPLQKTVIEEPDHRRNG